MQELFTELNIKSRLSTLTLKMILIDDDAPHAHYPRHTTAITALEPHGSLSGRQRYCCLCAGRAVGLSLKGVTSQLDAAINLETCGRPLC